MSHIIKRLTRSFVRSEKVEYERVDTVGRVIIITRVIVTVIETEITRGRDSAIRILLKKWFVLTYHASVLL